MILVAGESLIDLVETPDGSRAPHPGGSPANVAVGLARLGLDVSLATQLGDDPYGALLRNQFEETGVQLAGDPTTDQPTSIAKVAIDSHGEASYDFEFTWAPHEFEIPDGIRLLHTGSLASQVAPGAEAIESLVERLSKTALISFDPNIRPSLMRSRPAAVRHAERIAEMSDIVKASESDLMWLYPDRRPEAVAYAWLAAGASIVVVTSRRKGWQAFARAGTVAESTHARTVVDTIGAGDAFTAAIIAGLDARGLLGVEHRKAIRDLAMVDMEDVSALGARAAVLTVGLSGAQSPARAELWPVRG